MRQILLLLFGSLLFFLVDGQTGSVSGRITAWDNNVKVAHVHVIMDTLMCSLEEWRGTISDKHGRYVMSDVAPGTYDLLVIKLGFPDQRIKKVCFKAGQTTFKDIHLDIPQCSSNHKNKTCPICHSKEAVVSITYEFPIYPHKMDTASLHYAWRTRRWCDANWYCKKDKKEFGYSLR